MSLPFNLKEFYDSYINNGVNRLLVYILILLLFIILVGMDTIFTSVVHVSEERSRSELPVEKLGLILHSNMLPLLVCFIITSLAPSTSLVTCVL